MKKNSLFNSKFTVLILIIICINTYAGPMSGSGTRMCFENFRDNYSGSFIDFTYGTSPIPFDRRLDNEYTTSLGVTFSTHLTRFLTPYNPPHNVYVSNAAGRQNTIVGTPCSVCSDDGRPSYQMEFTNPQRYVGIKRLWDTTTRTKFYDINDNLLHEAIGSDFHGYLADSTNTNTWVSRLEITGVLDNFNNRQVGYSDDLFFGTNVPISTLQISASVDLHGMLDSNLKSPNACGITSFTVSADIGYTTDLAVGGTCPAGTWDGNTYTLNNTVANCVVSFTHSINTYSITPSVSMNGSISPNTVQIVDYGMTIQFTLTPDLGYYPIVNTTCGGNLVSDIYTTDPIINDCTIDANFLLINIFEDQFETLIVNKFIQSLQSMNNNDSIDTLIYSPEDNNLEFYGFIFTLNQDGDNTTVVSEIHDWIIEILAIKAPYGDFDKDGLSNEIDYTINL